MKLVFGFVLFLISSVFSCASAQIFFSEIDSLYDAEKAPFYFGVASGDPMQNQVTIWTKIITETPQVEVSWEIATDTLMQSIIQSGIAVADSSSAYTLKVNVANLSPNTTYFYRFAYQQKYSPIGRTKTAPTETDKLKFAVVSCNNYTNGYFNAFRAITFRNDIDAVIHLGDYIYEYQNKSPLRKVPIRDHIPLHEVLTLQDYRSRYAQYRLDKDLQELHRLFPFITIWDDHEIANNAYKEGAQNHQKDEGDWDVRKGIARKVYFEWLPLQENDEKSIIRKINYGNLAEIFMLDGRLEGRSKQVKHYTDSNLLSTDRFMLGNEQASWLEEGIKNSSARWKVIGNQVMFSEMDVSHLSKKIGKLMDSWDGYPAERERLMNFFYANNIKNLIILTGDIHSAWAFDLVANPTNKESYNRKAGKGVIGAEFITTSISSSNADERVARGIARMVGSLVKNTKHAPHLKYNNIVDHGYLTLTLTENEARADWHYVRTLRVISDKTRPTKSWSTFYNNNRLIKNKD